MTLYYSPGGGNSPRDSQTVADNQAATFYRTLTDFHGGWYEWGGLQQAIFIAGNFTAASLHNASNTWPDLDMMPMGPGWWGKSTEQDDRGQTIATLWVVGRYPLFSAGALPLDNRTLSYLVNPLALALNRREETESAPIPTRVFYEGNCTCSGGLTSCTIPHGPEDHPALPCLAKWVAPVPAVAAAAAHAAPKPACGRGAASHPSSTTSSSFSSSSLWTALAVINLGEDAANTTTGFAEMGLPARATDSYAVLDVWTGQSLGVFAGDATIATALRPHASVLLQVAVAAAGDGGGRC